MRYVHIDSVEPGQQLGQTIYSSNGTTLISAGVQLTVYMINTLRRIGVTMLYIQDPNFADVEINDILSEETKHMVLGKMSETMEAIRSGKEFNTKSIGISIDYLLDDVMRNKEVLVQLSDIRTTDNESYVHAMNVCMMSVLIGINMNLNQLQLKDLAIGALLHDIGKVEGKGSGTATADKKSEETASEAGQAGDKLSEHTWRGFEYLKQKKEFNLLIAHVALQHHETLDGLGSPRKLTGDEIHLYARIVAVANMFDNLLFAETDEKRMLPHEACEYMVALAETKLDREVLIQFLRTVSIYPTGISVKLSTKEVGVVVGQHRGLPGRPVVRIVRKEDSDDIQVKEIDLATHPTLFIDSVL